MSSQRAKVEEVIDEKVRSEDAGFGVGQSIP